MSKLSVRVEEVRPENDPEGGCFVVWVGRRVIAFEPNIVRAEGTAHSLREIIREARAEGKKTT